MPPVKTTGGTNRSSKMLMKTAGMVLTALGLIGATFAFAAERSSADSRPETLSFEDAIRRGVSHHPLLRIAQHDVLQTMATTKQVEAANYPWITGVFANTAGNTRVLANLGISG